MNDVFRRYLFEGEEAGSRYVLSTQRKQSVGPAGAMLGSGIGTSLEFLDHREYYPGDDIRRIDWSAFARSDRLTLKLFREEVSPHLDVLLDGSRSIELEDSAKCRAFLGLAALFVQAAENAGYSHTVWITSDEGCRKILNGEDRPAVWESLEFSSVTSPTEALGLLPPPWRPYGIRVFISDLLWAGDPLTTLRFFADKAALLMVAQVVAEHDADPKFGGNLQLVDIESNEILPLFLDEGVRKRYQEAFARHQETWRLAAKQVGATMFDTVAERLIVDWRLDELVAAGILQVK